MRGHELTSSTFGHMIEVLEWCWLTMAPLTREDHYHWLTLRVYASVIWGWWDLPAEGDGGSPCSKHLSILLWVMESQELGWTSHHASHSVGKGSCFFGTQLFVLHGGWTPPPRARPRSSSGLVARRARRGLLRHPWQCLGPAMDPTFQDQLSPKLTAAKVWPTGPRPDGPKVARKEFPSCKDQSGMYEYAFHIYSICIPKISGSLGLHK